MSVEHHDLVHELPEYRDAIGALKAENTEFRKLLTEYEALTQEVENMEDEVTPASTSIEEEAKLRRLHLKDALFAMLQEHANT